MIDIRKLKELVRLMVQHELMEIDLRDGKEQVTVRRGGGGQAAPVVYSAPAAMPAAPHHAPSVPAPAHAPAGGSTAATPARSADEGLIAIESPMVGTFYSAPDPDSPPFLNAGDHVSPGKVVCLIEAMKIFNEIKSEVAGRVERVLVKNGQAVEFGQKLFMVRPE